MKFDWKKPKKSKTNERYKDFYNFSSGHPSNFWPGSMLLNFGATKWPPKIEQKMAITFLGVTYSKNKGISASALKSWVI